MKRQISLLLGLPLIILVFSGMFIIRYKHSRSFRIAFLATFASLMFYLAISFPGLAQAIDSVENAPTQQTYQNRSRSFLEAREEKKTSKSLEKRKKSKGRSKKKAVVRTLDDLDKKPKIKEKKTNISILIQYDVVFQNQLTKIDIRSTRLVNDPFSDVVVIENDSIEQGIRHTVEIEAPIKIKTKELKKDLEKPKNSKKFNRGIHTIHDLPPLPTKRGDLVIDDKLKFISPYDPDLNQRRIDRLL